MVPIIAEPGSAVQSLDRSNRVGLAASDTWVLSTDDQLERRLSYRGSYHVNMGTLFGLVTNYQTLLLDIIFGSEKPTHMEKKTASLQAVLHAIGLAQATASSLKEDVLVKYPGHHKWYVKTGKAYGAVQGGLVTHTFVTAIIDSLESLGWVKRCECGGSPASFFRVLADAIPKDLAGYQVALGSPSLIHVSEHVEEVGADGATRKVTKTSAPAPGCAAEANARYNDLVEINTAAVKNTYSVVCDNTLVTLSPAAAQYHCIYNSSDLTKGGRLYCQLQNLPSRSKKIRDSLRINGESTVEVDYSNLHIRMLYAEKGVEFRGDCYNIDIDIPGWNVPAEDKRRLLKVILLALPNCGDPNAGDEANRRTALNTCRSQYAKWLGSHGALSKKRENLNDLLPHPYRLPEGYTCEVILDAILAAHPIITDCFFTGRGVYLQATDAKIACHILKTFAKLGKPCVGVHDSFIVLEQDEALLRSLMLSTYRNHVGMEPVVDAKKKPARVYDYEHELVGGTAAVYQVQV